MKKKFILKKSILISLMVVFLLSYFVFLANLIFKSSEEKANKSFEERNKKIEKMEAELQEHYKKNKIYECFHFSDDCRRECEYGYDICGFIGNETQFRGCLYACRKNREQCLEGI